MTQSFDRLETRPADLVLEGGGVRGIGLVGALAVAEERGYHWVNIAGTSAGAIVGAMVAAGYSAQEIAAIMETLDYRKFRDPGLLDRVPLLGPALSLAFEKGIYEGKYLEQLLEAYLSDKGVRTFGDLVLSEYAEDPRYRYRLRVIASDVSRRRMLVLPQDIAQYGIAPDDLAVAQAVRMSMSIPFFYEPVALGARGTGEESLIVDGGLLSNFPVWLFDTQEGVPQWPTFGIRLVEGDRPEPSPSRNEIRGPISLLGALFTTMMEAHDARYIEDQDFVRTIPVPTLGIRSTDFDLSRKQSQALYASGRGAAEQFFARWNFERYVESYRRDTSRHGRKLPLEDAELMS